VSLLTNPMVLRMGMLMFVAMAAFGFALIVIRQLRKSLVDKPESFDHAPLAPEGLPVHAYHAVIQQLKQQKSELAAQQLSERRKAKASDNLSSTILSNLSCGVLFFNSSGLVRQANAAARKLLGFESPIGLHIGDLLRTAMVRPETDATTTAQPSVEEALAPALAGKATIRGLVVNYFTRDGGSQILEVTASPVLADDATLMGTSGIVELANGDLWLNSANGILEIEGQQTTAALNDSSYRTKTRLFSHLDGLTGSAGTAAFSNSSILSADDGRLYVNTFQDILWIDPNNIHKNEIAPEDAPDSDPLTESSPAAPLVPLTSESRDPFESVITFALTPIPAELIAEASDASVASLSLLSTLKVCP